MKSESYDALAAINRGFDEALKSLTILKAEGVLTADYVQQQTEVAEELRAGLNYMILNKLERRENDDRDHFGKMRIAAETKLKEQSKSKSSV